MNVPVYLAYERCMISRLMNVKTRRLWKCKHATTNTCMEMWLGLSSVYRSSITLICSNTDTFCLNLVAVSRPFSNICEDSDLSQGQFNRLSVVAKWKWIIRFKQTKLRPMNSPCEKTTTGHFCPTPWDRVIPPLHKYVIQHVFKPHKTYIPGSPRGLHQPRILPHGAPLIG